MPKLPIDYSKACIYEIVCKDVNVTQRYIGKTTNLTQRRGCHKSARHNEFGRGYNTFVYQFIRENGGFVNWSVVLVEALPDCKGEKCLSKSERKWMVGLKSELNRCVPSITREEWLEENKEEVAQNNEMYDYDYYKRWRDSNKVKVKGYQQKYKEEKAREKARRESA
jgi:hypothetical protein